MKKAASSRIVNSKESETWYPWMAFPIRFEPNFQTVDGKPIEKDRKPKKGEDFIIRRTTCTGSIISSR